MQTRRLFRALVSVAALAANRLAAAGPTPAARGPNVLLLMTDEHNPRVLRCAGDPLVQTPTLDSLAARGVRFSAAYCQNPICVPSRVSLVSGRMPSNLATFGNTTNQTYAGITTLADVFNTAGYRTAWFGKTHWGEPRFQDYGRQGRVGRDAAADNDETASRLPQDSFVSPWPIEKNPEHATADLALDFLTKNRDARFFLGVSFVKPHFPFTIQQKYYDLYAGKVPAPRTGEKLVATLPAISKQEREKYGHAKATDADILRTKAIYYGMVTYVDEEFGRILRRLDELGLRDNTIIVYTADHGEMLGDRGIWYKNSFYDGSATIPFIWSFPQALPPGRVVATPAMNLDVFPTLCELAGLPTPAGLEGRSLLPVLRGDSDGRDRIALSENFRGNFAGRMIRTAQWKYFFYTNGDEYLYDLAADPGEENNLVHPEPGRGVVVPAHRALADELKARASAGWVQAKRTVRDLTGQPADGAAPPARKKRKS
ncbi:MAG: sulfatase-like hydrolase/transferase [Verrucomicrobia bacterium]|nr:sulfatase-like hydrolase/transferase [Verrucomicrobiota bacterium]